MKYYVTQQGREFLSEGESTGGNLVKTFKRLGKWEGGSANKRQGAGSTENRMHSVGERVKKREFEREVGKYATNKVSARDRIRQSPADHADQDRRAETGRQLGYGEATRGR